MRGHGGFVDDLVFLAKEIIDGDDVDMFAEALEFLGEVDAGAAEPGADFDGGVAVAEIGGDGPVELPVIHEAGDGGPVADGASGEALVDGQTFLVLFRRVLAAIGSVGWGEAEGGVVVGEDEVFCGDDLFALGGGVGEEIVGVDAGEAGVEHEHVLEPVFAGHNGDAEEIVGAAAVGDGEDGGFVDVAEAGEDFGVPAGRREEVVADLDEDLGISVECAGVPGVDAAEIGGGDFDVMHAPEGVAFGVVGVEDEEVFDAVGGVGQIQPGFAGVAGFERAAAGGVDEGDGGAAGGVEAGAADGFGLGGLAVASKGLAEDVFGEVAVESATFVPVGRFATGQGHHHPRPGEAVRGEAVVETMASHDAEGFAPRRVGFHGLEEEGFFFGGVFRHLDEIEPEFVFFRDAEFFVGEGFFCDGDGIIETADGGEFALEMVELAAVHFFDGDAFEDAKVAFVAAEF